MACLFFLCLFFFGVTSSRLEAVYGEGGLYTYTVKIENGVPVYHLLADPSGNATSCDHFSYDDSRPDGPKYWGDICVAWKACSQGKRQSPVDIITSTATRKDGDTFTENYAPIAATQFVNNGHAVVASPMGPTKSILKGGPLGNDYVLLQYHYHTPSEHYLDGVQFPLELHLVHRSTADPTKYAVIALFFESSILYPSVTLSYLIQAMNSSANFTEENSEFTLDNVPLHNELFPAAKEKSYYSYLGSLTTPPCSEIVTWFVMEKPLYASPDQIKYLSKFVHDNNARPLLDIGTRQLTYYTPHIYHPPKKLSGGVVALIVIILIAVLFAVAAYFAFSVENKNLLFCGKITGYLWVGVANGCIKKGQNTLGLNKDSSEPVDDEEEAHSQPAKKEKGRKRQDSDDDDDDRDDRDDRRGRDKRPPATKGAQRGGDDSDDDRRGGRGAPRGRDRDDDSDDDQPRSKKPPPSKSKSRSYSDDEEEQRPKRDRR